MLVKFETKGCPSCKKMNAIFEKYDLEPDKTIVIDETNVDVAEKFKVYTFPTVLFTSDFEDGDEYEEFDRIEGLPSMSRIKEFLCIED